ncbi:MULTISPECIES: hypothetical protein [unclassified Clostridium]|jgi:hypothetical protein|uniref:hypothetical protein n=1 Tax=unclassified Clostridium TaxID=2614128 RepID=UPI0025BA30B8|nr:hypothetical protein [Clostridium sp.]MCI6693211.1 hypothetical protein [Clostridium sp.]MDY2630502.1 hypothetical protein [Clostridium sp.]MDY4252203.1 hypothetical protein [Clostridium sp.]MDY6227942.1 hypothetical protein [Clostridium sp.]
MDCFYEQFQTKDYRSIEKIINILKKVSLSIAILLMAMLNIVGAIFFALVYFGISLLSRQIIVEYEYELTGNELSIYKIMNKSKRRELGSFNIKEITSVRTLEKLNGNTKFIKAYLSDSGIKPMVYVVNTSEGVTGFQLAVDEKLLDLIKKVNPLVFY